MQANTWNGVYGLELDSPVYKVLPGYIDNGPAKPDGARSWKVYRQVPANVDTEPLEDLCIRGIQQLNEYTLRESELYVKSDAELDARLTVGLELIDESGTYEPPEAATQRRFRVALRFRNHVVEQERNLVMEAHQDLRFPGLADDSILKGVKFRLSVYIQSTGRRSDTNLPAWGPSTVIRAIELALADGNQCAYQDVLKQQKLTDVSEEQAAEIKEDLAEATSHVKLSFSDLYVKGCVCGDRVDCPFHRGQVEAYDRLVPVSSLDTTDPVPAYEAQNTIDQEITDDWILHTRLPAYHPSLNEIVRDFERFCDAVGNHMERPDAMELSRAVDAAQDEPDLYEERSRRTSRMFDQYSDIQARLQAFWANLSNGERQSSSWNREKNAIKTLTDDLSSMLDMDTEEHGLSHLRRLYVMIHDRMTPLILEGTDISILEPTNFDRIIDARREFWEDQDAAVIMFNRIRDKRGDFLSGTRRVIGLPGRGAPLIWRQDDYTEHSLTTDNLRALFAISECRRIKMLEERSNDELDMKLLERISEDGQALRQVIKDYNALKAGPYTRSASYQKLSWAICAWAACVEMVHQTIDVVAASRGSMISVRRMVNNGIEQVGQDRPFSSWLDEWTKNLDIRAPDGQGAAVISRDPGEQDILYDMWSTTGMTPSVASTQIETHENALARIIGNDFVFIKQLLLRAMSDQPGAKATFFFQPVWEGLSKPFPPGRSYDQIWNMLTVYQTMQHNIVILIHRSNEGGYTFVIRGWLAAWIKDRRHVRTLDEALRSSKVILFEEGLLSK